MRNRFLLFVLLLFVASSCAHYNPDSYKVKDLVGVSHQKSKLYFTYDGPTDMRGENLSKPQFMKLLGIAGEDENYKNIINECYSRAKVEQIEEAELKGVSVALITLAAAAGKAIFDWYIEKKSHDLQDL